MPKNSSLEKQLGYRDYFLELEQHLGELLLPLTHRANSPKTIVSSDALHNELARHIAIEIYQSNECLGMESPVSLFSTLDALGALRYKLEVKETTDTQSIEFLERVGEATITILAGKTISK